MSNLNALIERLDSAWDIDGFLGRVRNGCFDLDQAQEMLALLRSLCIYADELLPKRLVTLLWYLPSFLEWQSERVAEKCGNKIAYAAFKAEVFNILEEILGVP